MLFLAHSSSRAVWYEAGGIMDGWILSEGEKLSGRDEMLNRGGLQKSERKQETGDGDKVTYREREREQICGAVYRGSASKC